MPSNLEIVNMALGMLGEINQQNRMTTFNISACNTDAQFACLDFYTVCKEEMLAYMDWPRASKIKALTLSSADPIIDGLWLYKYARPEDALIIRAVIDTSKLEYKWELGAEVNSGESSLTDEFIYTDLEDAYCRYTYSLLESRYTVGMAMLHSAILAERVAMTVTSERRHLDALTAKLHQRIEILSQKLAASEGYVENEHGEDLMTEVF